VDRIVIADANDLGKLNDTWPTLMRRSNSQQISVDPAVISDSQRILVEDGINNALVDCGCKEGAVGVVGFTMVVASVLLIRRANSSHSRHAIVTRRRGTYQVVGAAVVGGVVGKLTGLMAARSRFLRHRRLLDALLNPANH